jgi:hypothetical protein
MLQVLVKNSNEYLKEMVLEEETEIERDEEEDECYIQDLLAQIWVEAKNSPETNVPDSEVKPIPPTAIEELIRTLKSINRSNQYLGICLMRDLPPLSFCTKILDKFTKCGNMKLKQRVFDWLMETMKDPECREKLKVNSIISLKKLIEISKEKSRNLFNLYFPNKKKEIINLIDSDPQLQL